MTRSQVTSSFERARTDTPLSNAEKVQETPARNAQETLRSQDTSSFVDEGFTVVDDWEEEDQLVAHSKRKASVDPSSRNPKRTHSPHDSVSSVSQSQSTLTGSNCACAPIEKVEIIFEDGYINGHSVLKVLC